MNRRNFINTLSLALAGLAGLAFADDETLMVSGKSDSDYKKMVDHLLREWCDGMLRHQVNDPGNPALHGVLKCPACDVIHGRCWDSMYPFMRMARVTGEKKYLDAAINAFEWSKNVSGPDGRWTNDLSPSSWAGITVFGAIALAESIKYHGDLLPPDLLVKWKKRLSSATEGYIYPTFTNFTDRNMNYGMTSIYAFNLIGRVLDEQKYIDRSRILAKDVRKYFTAPNKLIYGEGKPTHKRSPKGLLMIDLGYNVEESLNNLVLYALQEKDEELLKFLTESMNSHLEFILCYRTEHGIIAGARGPWRATISADDAHYTRARQRHIQQAAGGSLSVLYHTRVGPLFTASMAKYMQVEPKNTQPQPGEECALTPRIETLKNGVVYNNLYDLQAEVKSSDDGKTIRFDVLMGLFDLNYKKLKGDVADYKVSYQLNLTTVTITVETTGDAVSKNNTFLILPLLSPSGEPVKRVSEKQLKVTKPEGTVLLKSSAPLKIKKIDNERIFNMVPGMECLPIMVAVPKKTGMTTTCIISVT